MSPKKANHSLQGSQKPDESSQDSSEHGPDPESKRLAKKRLPWAVAVPISACLLVCFALFLAADLFASTSKAKSLPATSEVSKAGSNASGLRSHTEISAGMTSFNSDERGWLQTKIRRGKEVLRNKKVRIALGIIVGILVAAAIVIGTLCQLHIIRLTSDPQPASSSKAGGAQGHRSTPESQSQQASAFGTISFGIGTGIFVAVLLFFVRFFWIVRRDSLDLKNLSWGAITCLSVSLSFALGILLFVISAWLVPTGMQLSPFILISLGVISSHGGIYIIISKMPRLLENMKSNPFMGPILATRFSLKHGVLALILGILLSIIGLALAVALM